MSDHAKEWDELSKLAIELHDQMRSMLEATDKVCIQLIMLGDSTIPYIESRKRINQEEEKKATEYLNTMIWTLWQWTIIPQAIGGEKEYINSIAHAFHLTTEQVQKAIADGEKQEQEKRRHELANLPYKEYLQTPEWQERRKRILERDGYRCQVCNSSNRLNIHHRDYTRRGYENDSDLTTLCQGCHQVFHENSRLVRVEV